MLNMNQALNNLFARWVVRRVGTALRAMWDNIYIYTLWLWLAVCHGIDGPNRNRWFTELKNGGSFHGYVSHNQRVYIFTINDHPSLKVALLSLEGSDNPSDPRVWGDNLRLTTLETDGVWTKKQCFVFQGLVNVPFWGFVSHHLKKYLLEIISYYIPNIWVMF